MTDGLERERALLETLSAGLQAEGFDVILHPSRLQLPKFLQDVSPDAIARRGDENLIIEIVGEGALSRQRLEVLRDRLSKQSTWRLRAYSVMAPETPKPLEVASIKIIASTISQIDQLLAAGHLLPALLLEWATLEAVGRVVLPDQFGRPQTPARLVEVLARSGKISPTAADKLR
ncbi:MAG: hypothetical protein KGR48_16825, partial [Alphaproteobacteria bacterium]|nr:hypothetical protein [Alphaproteobacteria bacterium]